jgi:hypothetical protein
MQYTWSIKFLVVHAQRMHVTPKSQVIWNKNLFILIN